MPQSAPQDHKNTVVSGSTTDHGTVKMLSRSSRGRGIGKCSRNNFWVSRHRIRGPNAAKPLVYPNSRRKAAIMSEFSAPGTFRWISILGNRSATSEGFATSHGCHANVSDTGPRRSSNTQLARLPSSSHVPSMKTPPGASRPHTILHASGTCVTSYCRNTLKAPH